MISDPEKPTFPSSEELDFKYLASVGIDIDTLDRCCVQKAKVVGVDSRQTISISVDGETFTDVPVWIHTDIGARKALIGESEYPAPADYFMDAALLFPFPGFSDETSPYVTAIIHTDQETEIRSALGVIGVIQNFYSETSCTIDSHTDIAPFIKPAIDIANGFRTYRPYLYVRSAQYSSAIKRGEFVSLYDLSTGSFALIPSYTRSVPVLPMSTADVVKYSSAQNITSFLSHAIKIGAGDCFQNLTSADGTDLSIGGLVDSTYSFKDRDSDETITVTRDSKYWEQYPPITTCGQEHNESASCVSPLGRTARWYDWQEYESSYGTETTITHSKISQSNSSSIGLAYTLYTYDQWEMANRDGPPLYECNIVGDGIYNAQTLRGATDTHIEFDVCKNFLFDVYSSVFVSCFITQGSSTPRTWDGRYYEFDVTSCAAGPSSGYVYGTPSTIENQNASVAGGSYQRGAVFDTDIAPVIESIATLLVDPLRGGPYYYVGAKIEEVSLYLVPYDIDAGLLSP